MAKEYLDIQGLQELVDYVNLQIEACRSSFATARKAGIIKPGIGLAVTDDGTLSITDEYTEGILDKADGAASRAAQSAVVAGNYAAQAIQAQQAVDNKLWYGTMDEYNALEVMPPKGTIFIILD